VRRSTRAVFLGHDGGDEEELHQIFAKPLSPLGNAGGQTASNRKHWTTNLDHLNIPKQGPRAGVLTTARRQDPAMSRAANRLPVDRKVLERRGFQPLAAMCQGATSPPPVAPFNAVLRSGSRGVVASMPRLFGARSVVHSSTPAEDVMGIPFPYARHLDNQRRSVPGEAAHCRRL